MIKKSQYNKKGMYNGYDKHNKERDALDYYATPTQEVTNILNLLQLDLKNNVVLEPCCGGGHMIEGILNYEPDAKIIATDIKDRGYTNDKCKEIIYNQDFLSDNYIERDIDYIIMNPPFSTIEAFAMKSLGIANKGVLMLGRLQFIEGQSRYNKIFSQDPPSDIYVYVDRINCYKNGIVDPTMANGAQAYAWFFWDCEKETKETIVHWIRRA